MNSRKLSKEQLGRLHLYEEQLKSAAINGEYDVAKLVMSDLQPYLRQLHDETRLQKNKALLFEAAMNSGFLDLAISGFIGVRGKTEKRTKIYLQATALLAICYIRKGDFKSADSLISFVISHKKNIKSEVRRRLFVRKVVNRFEEECALYSLRNTHGDYVAPEDVQNMAGELLLAFSEDELFDQLGRNAPKDTISLLLKIDGMARKQLLPAEIKYLPEPQSIENNCYVGKTLFSSVKRVVWRSLCDKNSEVYKVWHDGGIKLLLNKYSIGIAITQALMSSGINVSHLAVIITALVIRFGIDVYCDRYKPEDIMVD